MKKYPASTVAWLIAAALMPTVASAQQTEPEPASVRRPYRGLFAPPQDPRSQRQSLDASFSLFGAYDDDVYEDQRTPSTDAVRPAGWYTGAIAGLAYTKPGERASLSAVADVGLNYHRDRDDTFGSYRTAAELSFSLARQTILELGGSFSYSPEYRLGLFLSPDSLTGWQDPFSTIVPDTDIYRLKAHRSAAQLQISQGMGRRASVDGWYAFGMTDYEESGFDYRSQTAGASYRHQLSQHATARIGYSYNVARYMNQTGLRPQRLHNIDAGVDYGRALSFSRRTTLSFSTGSAMVVRDDLARPESSRDFTFRFIGNADLNHEMGRTWTARAGYRRGVDFHEGFNEPFLSDAVNAAVDGLFSRRVRFRSTADYAWGTVGLGTANHYESLSATAGLEFGLTRALAFYTRYVYYRYNFDQNLALDPRFIRALDRQGVRVGLTASFPIVR